MANIAALKTVAPVAPTGNTKPAGAVGAPKPAIAPDAIKLSTTAPKANPLATPKRSLASRILGAFGWGAGGMAIGGAVGAGAAMALDLGLHVSLGFGGFIGLFCGAGLLGAAAGAIYGATHKASRGAVLANPANLDADPNASRIKSLLSQANSASGAKAQALFDQASKAATTGEAAAYIAKQAEKKKLDPMPYYDRASDLSTSLQTSLAIAEAVRDYRSNWSGNVQVQEPPSGYSDAEAQDALDRAYSKAAAQATPAQAASFAPDAVKNGAGAGASAAYTKAMSKLTTTTAVMNLFDQTRDPAFNVLSPEKVGVVKTIGTQALALAKTPQDASDVANLADEFGVQDLAQQAVAKGQQLRN
ncbi:MAG TPA: hypothetical protein V6D47_12505 [Oscillatoriaceae cyanobacterium]